MLKWMFVIVLILILYRAWQFISRLSPAKREGHTNKNQNQNINYDPNKDPRHRDHFKDNGEYVDYEEVKD